LRQNDELTLEALSVFQGCAYRSRRPRRVLLSPKDEGSKNLMNRNQSIPDARGIKIRAKRPKIRAEDSVKRYQDLLEIARLVSWCMNRDYLIKTCLDHLSQRLRKRARYVLMEGDDLKLHCWVGRYDCPIEQVPVCKESIVWRAVKKGIPVNLTIPMRLKGTGIPWRMD